MHLIRMLLPALTLVAGCTISAPSAECAAALETDPELDPEACERAVAASRSTGFVNGCAPGYVPYYITRDTARCVPKAP